MVLVVILLALAFIAVLGLILLRRRKAAASRGYFYMRGREAGFVFHGINLLRRVAVEAKLENPPMLFWSMKQLDRSIKGIIISGALPGAGTRYNRLLGKLFELRKRVEFDQPKYKPGIKSSRKVLPKQHLRLCSPVSGLSAP